MSETPDELRARLGAYVAAFQDTPSTEERVAWARQIVNAWPEIDALLARLATAEAIIDKAKAVAHVEGLFQGGFEPPVDLVLAEMITEALARREQP